MIVQQSRVVLATNLACAAGTLSQAFAAKHRESHNRTATYKHPLVQALLGRVSEWWTGAWYGNIPETDRWVMWPHFTQQGLR
jgi:hypothetical protein